MTISKTPQASLDMQGANAIKKNKRVNVESGYKRRSFKLSLVFLLLQFISIVLAYLIVIKDLMIYSTDKKLKADLMTIHNLNMIIQFDVYAFQVISSDRRPSCCKTRRMLLDQTCTKISDR